MFEYLEGFMLVHLLLTFFVEQFCPFPKMLEGPASEIVFSMKHICVLLFPFSADNI